MQNDSFYLGKTRPKAGTRYALIERKLVVMINEMSRAKLQTAGVALNFEFGDLENLPAATAIAESTAAVNLPNRPT